MLTEFCSFIEEIYGGSHRIEDNQMGHKILVIENGSDKFKINLTDKERFGKYTVSHRDSGRKLDGRWCYHVQIRCRDLSYGIFVAYTHYFNTKNGIFNQKEDYHRFMKDWRKSLS